MSWCYIPVGNTDTQSSGASPHRQSPRKSTSSKHFLPGGTKISLVVRENDPPQTDSFARRHARITGMGFHSNEKPLSEELAVAGMQGELHSSTPRYPSPQASAAAIPKLTLRRATLDAGNQDGAKSSGDEVDEDRGSPFSPWGRDLSRGGARYRYNPSLGEEGDAGSGASLEDSSVYSCASTSDSIASGSNSDLLDCHKLIKLINQPTLFKVTDL